MKSSIFLFYFTTYLAFAYGQYVPASFAGYRYEASNKAQVSSGAATQATGYPVAAVTNTVSQSSGASVDLPAFSYKDSEISEEAAHFDHYDLGSVHKASRRPLHRLKLDASAVQALSGAVGNVVDPHGEIKIVLVRYEQNRPRDRRLAPYTETEADASFFQ